jgi:thiosulfate dehydrogenase
MQRLLRATAAVLALAACDTGNTTPSDSGGPATTAATAAFDAAAWRPPADSEIPNDSLGASIRRGLALIRNTPDSLPAHAPGKITCQNCHLDGGRNVAAAPLAGSHARFPKYMDRTGAVIALADRVNYCFTRSLAGTKIPADSREMQDILAYIAWLSRGVPVGAKLPGAEGLLAMPAELVGDEARGAEVFTTKCQVCHMENGEGGPAIPALWGPKSFSVGASMSRRTKAASFIWHNMPFGQGRTLTHQQAFDVAAYIASKPRLDSPGKEHDWPVGGAPGDVPYATKGRAAFKPPPLLPRANAAATIVPRPTPVVARGGR